VDAAYSNFQFFKASQLLLKFCSNDLSSFYLDIAKDRLYISEEKSHRRRSAQTVMTVLVQGLAQMVAPILPHLAEDMWMNLPFPAPTQSVFQAGWTQHNFEPHEEDEWKELLKIRGDVNKCIEVARREKLVGSNNDCLVHLFPPDERTRDLLQKYIGDEDLRWPPSLNNAVDELKYILMVSQVGILSDSNEIDHCDIKLGSDDTESGCAVGVQHAFGAKCMRCWMYCPTVGSDSPHLCPRCSHAVRSHESGRSN
jgi:isoleucyl-tRNA synthetase